MTHVHVSVPGRCRIDHFRPRLVPHRVARIPNIVFQTSRSCDVCKLFRALLANFHHIFSKHILSSFFWADSKPWFINAGLLVLYYVDLPQGYLESLHATALEEIHCCSPPGVQPGSPPKEMRGAWSKSRNTAHSTLIFAEKKVHRVSQDSFWMLWGRSTVKLWAVIPDLAFLF